MAWTLFQQNQQNMRKELTQRILRLVIAYHCKIHMWDCGMYRFSISIIDGILTKEKN